MPILQVERLRPKEGEEKLWQNYADDLCLPLSEPAVSRFPCSALWPLRPLLLQASSPPPWATLQFFSNFYFHSNLHVSVPVTQRYAFFKANLINEFQVQC